MSEQTALKHALQHAGLSDSIESIANLSGGCIHRVLKIELSDQRTVVAKINSAEKFNLFEEEAAGLEALAKTKTVLVPKVLATVTHSGLGVLLMTEISRKRSSSNPSENHIWRRFGEDLAALHRADAGRRYGFSCDNHLGTTFQPNQWKDDWVEFNAEHRLGHQLQLARNRSLVREDESVQFQRVIDRLDKLIPRTPKPVVLHGDLWAGNAIIGYDEQTNSTRVAMIDPATSIGDGWADIAMMQLFGGFNKACFEAYTYAVDDHADLDSRIGVYQLYHILNHVNIFGRGYIGQALSLAKSLAE